MFNKNIKLVLAVIILAWAVFEFTKGHIMNGISIVLLAGIFVFFYFKNEILLLTFFKLRKQDFEGGNKLLDRIKNPSSALTSQTMAFSANGRRSKSSHRWHQVQRRAGTGDCSTQIS